jgi:hypothetical protein
MKHFSILRRALLLGALATGGLTARAQTGGVGIGTTAPDASAALDIVSSSKGALLPRVADATAIANPATGLVVFQTGGTPGFYYYVGGQWQQIATAAGAAVTASNGLTKTGQTIGLGGQLNAPTTIAQAGNNLALTGGSVGIGTGAPQTTLDVSGDFRVSAGTVNSSLGTTGSANANFSGALGQSFTLPVAATITSIRLVAGGASFSTTFQIHNGAGPSGATLLPAPQPIAFVANSPTTAVLTTPLSVPAGVYTIFLNTGSGSNNLRYFNGGENYTGGSVYSGSSAYAPLDLEFAVTYTSGTATSALAVNANGNVGIGTTGAPGQKLDVTGGSIRIGTSGNGLIFPDGTTQTTAATPAAATTAGNGLTKTGNTIALGGTALAAATDVPLAGNNLTFSGTSGNVGIGTTTPGARLEVNNDFRVSATSTAAQQLSQSSTPDNTNTYAFPNPGQSFAMPTAGTITSIFFANGSAGSYGTLTIYQGNGTGGPVLASQSVFVSGFSSSGMALATPLAVPAGQYTFTVTGVSFGYSFSYNAANPYAGGTAYSGATAMPGADLGFTIFYNGAGGTTTTLAATSGGKVGIGTATPAEALDVTGGNLKISTTGRGLIFPDGTTQTTAATPAAVVTAGNGLTRTGNNVALGGTALTAPTDVPLAGQNLTFSGAAGGVGIGTTAPDASAKLEVSSTSQGFLPPRLTSAQRAAIASPAAGLMVYQANGTRGIYYYDGTAWINLTNGRTPDANGSTTPPLPPNGGVVTTLAGTAGSYGSANGTGAAARFNNPYGVAVDAAGTVYVADQNNHTIRKITPAGVVSTLAGTAGPYGSADGTGAAARFNYPTGVAVDAAGVVYVADESNNTIRKITPAGVVSTLAGTSGIGGGSADGTGAAARFDTPIGVAVDASGTVYVGERNNHTIRKITPAGVVSTLAGTSGIGGGSADGTGAAARFNAPIGVAVDASGTVYVADLGNSTIRKITAAGVVSTLAGTAGLDGSANGTGAAARFSYPTGVAVDVAGTVYVADQSNQTIRVIK